MLLVSVGWVVVASRQTRIDRHPIYLDRAYVTSKRTNTASTDGVVQFVRGRLRVCVAIDLNPRLCSASHIAHRVVRVGTDDRIDTVGSLGSLFGSLRIETIPQQRRDRWVGEKFRPERVIDRGGRHDYSSPDTTMIVLAAPSAHPLTIFKRFTPSNTDGSRAT